MAQEYVASAGGQVSNPNRLTGRPGLRAVTNCVVDRPGVLKPRRGSAETVDIPTAENIHRLWDYQSALMAHYDDGGGVFRIAYFDGVSTWTDIASSAYQAPSGRKMAIAEASGGLYLTSAVGPLWMDTFSGAVAPAGAPTALCIDAGGTSTNDDAAGILQPQTAVAYRTCLYRKDSKGRVIQGAPSGRTVLRNGNALAASAKKPVLYCPLPKANGTPSTDLTTDWFLQVYRSSASPDLATNPPEDEALIYEAPLTSGQISNAFASVADVTPDALRGETIYTAPTRGGIGQANSPPPFAYEAVEWKGCLVYLNTISRQRFELQILAVGGTEGIQDGDVIAFSGSGTFSVAASTASSWIQGLEYHVETGGTFSAAQCIEATAQSLVAAINSNTSNNFLWAYYVGVPSEPRSIGKIILETRLAADQSFNVYVANNVNTSLDSKNKCFDPELPTDSPSSVIVSTCDEWTDGWAISKVRQPEAVPLLNTGRLGGGEHILRGISLGDSLFIFTKTGIWRMTGEPPLGSGDTGTVRLEPWRTTVWCVASETVRTLAGSIYALTNQGVVAVNESGVRIVSWDIEPDIQSVFAALAGSTHTNALLELYAFAVGYESDRKYILGLPAATSDTQAKTFLVYDHMQDSWVQWAFSDPYLERCTGFVRPSEDKLYLARNSASGAKIFRERKAFAAADHSDPSDTPIAISVRWWPLLGSNAGRKKLWRELALLFESGAPSSVALTIASDYASKTATIANVLSTVARTWVPQSVRRAARLDVTATWTVSGSSFEISALSALYRDYEGRLTK